MRSFSIFKKKMLLDKEVKKAYDALEPEYSVIRAMLRARVKKKLTQAQLAKKIGTKQSVISRLEKGKANPSVGFLKKFAKALDTRLEVRFISK